MQATVLCFALARELAGTSELTIPLDEPATVADLRAAIARACPALETLLPHLRIAVDGSYTVDSDPVEPGAEIALIPPVSGGWGAVRR